MHAYLIVGGENVASQKALELAKTLKAKVLEFPLQKIEDVRALGSYVSLIIDQPTAVLAKSVETATAEAMNAFLKNLEEPQEGLFYILTCSNTKSLPPTIISRCQIITLGRPQDSSNEVKSFAQSFLEAPQGTRLKLVADIKERQEALSFVTNFILGCHGLMVQGKGQHTIYSKAIRTASFTKAALEANGQIGIQLTNLVCSLV